MNTISFNPITNISRINYNKRHNNISLNNDVFVRTTSFGAKKKDDVQSFDEFEKWANETNFIANARDYINTGKIIGSGFEGKTIEIPNCDRWVIKQFDRSSFINQKIKDTEIVKVSDISPKLNVGQFVASVKMPLGHSSCEHFYVLKKQTGISHGVSYDCSDIVTDNTAKQHIESLKRVAKLPQASFDKLIGDIKYITQRGYKLDCSNPYNFMIDEQKQSVNFVDVADKVEKDNNQYGDVLYALLDGEFAENFNKSNRSQKEKDIADIHSRQICSKFIVAMMKKNEKFTDSEKFLKVFNSQVFDEILGEDSQELKVNKLIELGLY